MDLCYLIKVASFMKSKYQLLSTKWAKGQSLNMSFLKYGATRFRAAPHLKKNRNRANNLGWKCKTC
jgi:hypothetical protein